MASVGLDFLQEDICLIKNPRHHALFVFKLPPPGMGLHADMIPIREEDETDGAIERKQSQVSKGSQTASEFIDEQLVLEADAREVLPYKFDTCTKPLGPLRQNVFACLTCSPPPASLAQVYTPAGICYSCSISCHGDHNLVELFSRRNFACDCGTTRIPYSACTLRRDENTGVKHAQSEKAAEGNHYNQNFENLFCGCGEEYDAHLEKGTMYQCLGLGTVETGGCGEDWWHPECLMGLPKDWNKGNEDEKKIEVVDDSEAVPDRHEEHPVPPGFPEEDDFESLVCYKCVESNPWIKQYAGTVGFLAPVFRKESQSESKSGVPSASVDEVQTPRPSLKRKASDEEIERAISPIKRARNDEKDQPRVEAADDVNAKPLHKHDRLPSPPKGVFSLFLKDDFREHLCHCPQCYINLVPYQQLVEEEDTYEPPLSESAESGVPGSGARSQGTGSLLDRGEAALSAIDRVRAIEGVMVYNHLKDKVKDFLKPYAESGKPVGAEDIKAYFEKLRGDDAAIREAGMRPAASGDEDEKDGDNRKEQSGY